jgi:hypothetical protein
LTNSTNFLGKNSPIFYIEKLKKRKKKKTNPAHIGFVDKMGFFNDKKRTYILPDIQYRRRGTFQWPGRARVVQTKGACAHGPKYIKHQQKISGVFWGHVFKWNIFLRVFLKMPCLFFSFLLLDTRFGYPSQNNKRTKLCQSRSLCE